MGTSGGPLLGHLIDLPRQSFATLLPTDDKGTYTVRQGGPARLWDAVEDAIDTWRQAGSPPRTGFGLTVTGDTQTVWLGTPDGPHWQLPS